MNRFWPYVLLALLAGAACKQKEVAPAPGCQLSVTVDNYTYTYLFDTTGRVNQYTAKALGSVPIGSSKGWTCAYTYQGRQLTIDLTYSDVNWLRFRYDVTLNERGYLSTAEETMFNRLATGVIDENLVGSHTARYNAEGYLTAYHFDRYSYPFNAPRVTEPQDLTLSYDNGNLVAVTHAKGTSESSTSLTNQYGTQPNPLRIPFLLEDDFNMVIFNRAFQPLLGRPARNLLTSTVRKSSWSTLTQTISHTNRVNADGQSMVVQRSGDVLSAEMKFSYGCN